MCARTICKRPISPLLVRLEVFVELPHTIKVVEDEGLNRLGSNIIQCLDLVDVLAKRGHGEVVEMEVLLLLGLMRFRYQSPACNKVALGVWSLLLRLSGGRSLVNTNKLDPVLSLVDASFTDNGLAFSAQEMIAEASRLLHSSITYSDLILARLGLLLDALTTRGCIREFDGQMLLVSSSSLRPLQKVQV